MRLDGDSVVEKVLRPDNALRALATANTEQTGTEAGDATENGSPDLDPGPDAVPIAERRSGADQSEAQPVVLISTVVAQ